MIRTDEEELEDETATVLEQQTSLFSDLLSGHEDGPEQEAGERTDESLASAVARQLSVCLVLVLLQCLFVCCGCCQLLQYIGSILLLIYNYLHICATSSVRVC